MPTLNELLEEKLPPLTEAYRAISGCRSVPELRHALRTQEPIVKEAERFATSIAHVETVEARQFRDTVRMVRRTVEDRKGTLHEVVVSAEGQVVPRDTPSKLEPPANALAVSRAEMRDVRRYEAAKAQAKREGKELWAEN